MTVCDGRWQKYADLTWEKASGVPWEGATWADLDIVQKYEEAKQAGI